MLAGVLPTWLAQDLLTFRSGTFAVPCPPPLSFVKLTRFSDPFSPPLIRLQ